MLGKFCVRIVWIVFVVLGVLTAPCHGWSQSSLSVRYVGLRSIHLSYDYVVPDAYIGYTGNIRLVALMPDAREVLIAAEPANGETGLPVTLKGEYNHVLSQTDMGRIEYRLILTYSRNDLGTATTLIRTVSANVGERIYGTLLFDDTVDGVSASVNPVQVGSVTVPEGMILNIDSTDMAGGYISVHGEIQISPETSGKSTSISLYTPHAFSNITQLNLRFLAGSAGSSIANGNDITVFAGETDLLIDKVTPLTLEQSNWKGKVVVSNSSIPHGLGVRNEDQHLVLDTVSVEGSVFVSEKGRLTARNCSFGSYGRRELVRVVDSEPGHAVFENCQFRMTWPDEVVVSGGGPVFENCEFISSVRLENRNSGIFRNNLLTRHFYFTNEDAPSPWSGGGGGPKWSEPSEILPTIENNSFVGIQALSYSGTNPPPSPIPIGMNYYGDKGGPSITVKDVSNFFGKHGARVSPGKETENSPDIYFALAEANEQGRLFANNNVFPSFWAKGWIIGQSTISHQDSRDGPNHLFQGRETLASFEILTDHEVVDNVKVHAVFNGQVVNSTAPDGKSAYRDFPAFLGNNDRSWNEVSMAKSTFNIILPPVPEGVTEANLEVWLDTREVTGFAPDAVSSSPFGGPELKRIFSRNLSFLPPYGRKLRVTVYPVQIDNVGYSDAIPNAQEFVNHLKKIMPAMLPISKDEIYFRTGPLVRYQSIVPYVPLRIIVNVIARDHSIKNRLKSWWNANPTEDISVFLAANGVLRPAAGWYPTKYPGNVFVDEAHPVVTLHEMGHVFGLYLDQEQYNLWPPFGIPAHGITAFDTGGEVVGAIQTGAGTFPFEAADQKRIIHNPAPASPWHIHIAWHDIMGSDGTNYRRPQHVLWPTQETYGSFRTSLRSLLGSLSSSTGNRGTLHEHIAPDALKSGEPDLKRVFLFAHIEPFQSEGQIISRFKAGSLRAMNLSAIASNRLAPLAIGADAYRILAFDAQMNQVHSEDFHLPANPDGEEDVWSASFDIPGTATSLTVTRVADGQVYLRILASPLLATEISTPAFGAQLGGVMRVRWVVTGAVAQPENGQALQHYLLFSSDGGVTWDSDLLFLDGEEFSLPTDFLPAGKQIAIRLLTSDGLTTAESRVDNLRIDNRPPQVRIHSPIAQDRGDPATLWFLSASAWDMDNDDVAPGIWRSSIDGELGTGLLLSGIALSVGTHTITYTVADSQGGMTVTAAVVVHVDAQGVVDLWLDKDSLTVSPQGMPAGWSMSSRLMPGQTTLVALSMRNTGVQTSSKLSLYLQPPLPASEMLLDEKTLVGLSPFEEVSINASFVPTTEGEYRLRGVISDVNPADVDLENNQYAWTFNTVPTEPGALRVDITPETALWRRVGTEIWRSSGFTELDLAAEVIQVEFSIVPGYETQTVLTVTIESGQTAMLTAAYTVKADTYVITAAPSGQGGSVSGGDTYVHNALVRLEAVPDKGFRFAHWKNAQGQIVSTNPIHEFRAASGQIFTAHFRRAGLGGILMLLLE